MPALRPLAWMRSATAFIPWGKRTGSGFWRPYWSNPDFQALSIHQPASMLTYS